MPIGQNKRRHFGRPSLKNIIKIKEGSILEQLVDFIRNNDASFYGKGVDYKKVLYAENVLNTSFSEEYKNYLLNFGTVAYDGHELTGISEDNDYNDVVKITLEERDKFKDKIFKNLYVIEKTYIDDIIIWQSTNGAIYQSQPQSAIHKIADSIIEFLQL
ncbi:SMI1/KNR4 family protein [Streptococcus equinus]|uniref:SMI1/KNR4 family protein n=1 Tax=Streptococcus equinus TaxID=1335 RepID=UPI003C6FF3AC